mmetsp:Transcript_21860/g.32754  ORF Transcript_21860/g.32754 Transcript_21860/m.32754 type:complete len:135 (+) Transcript_21860:216-620(+)
MSFRIDNFKLYLRFQSQNLVSSVIDLAKEILILTGITIASQPQTEDGQMSSEQNGQEAKVIDAEPFVGAVSRDCGGGREDCRGSCGGSGHDALWHVDGVECAATGSEGNIACNGGEGLSRSEEAEEGGDDLLHC